jgi:hypothetical protein
MEKPPKFCIKTHRGGPLWSMRFHLGKQIGAYGRIPIGWGVARYDLPAGTTYLLPIPLNILYVLGYRLWCWAAHNPQSNYMPVKNWQRLAAEQYPKHVAVGAYEERQRVIAILREELIEPAISRVVARIVEGQPKDADVYCGVSRE